MIVKKLRLQHSWSQEQLAQFSGLSKRTIQRIERGKSASLESWKSLAAVFEVTVEELKPETEMNTESTNNTPSNRLTEEEADALEYVEELKAFYLHLMTFAVVTIFLVIVNFMTSSYPWVLWAIGGWGLGLAMHAIMTFDWFGIFSSDWEKKQVEKRLGRKL